MATTTSYMYGAADLTQFANQVKDRISVTANINLDDYVVIVSKPSRLGYFIKSLFGKNKDELSIFIMKVVEKGQGYGKREGDDDNDGS